VAHLARQFYPFIICSFSKGRDEMTLGYYYLRLACALRDSTALIKKAP